MASALLSTWGLEECSQIDAPLLLRTGGEWPWSPSSHSQTEFGKVAREAIVNALPRLEHRRSGGVGRCPPPSLYDLCPSPIEKWRSVVVVTPIPLLEGRTEGGYGLCPSLFLGSGGVEACGHGHPHPTHRKNLGRWP